MNELLIQSYFIQTLLIPYSYLELIPLLSGLRHWLFMKYSIRCMAVAILCLLLILPVDSIEILYISSLRPTIHMLKTLWRPQVAQEPQKDGKGLGPWAGPGQSLGTSPGRIFCDSEHPEAFPGSSAYQLWVPSCRFRNSFCAVLLSEKFPWNFPSPHQSPLQGTHLL